MFEVWVECKCSGREAFPVRFGWSHATRDVLEVDDWWPGDDHCYYRIRASDGCVYILRHHEPTGPWEVVVYETGPPLPIDMRRDAMLH